MPGQWYYFKFLIIIEFDWHSASEIKMRSGTKRPLAPRFRTRNRRVTKKARYNPTPAPWYRGITLQDSMYRTRRSVDIGVITVSGGSDAFGAYNFKLSNLPGYTDFSFFEQFRIVGVSITFIPDFNTNTAVWNGSANSYGNLPYLLTVVDYDDDTTPSTEDDLLKCEDCVISTPGQRFSRYFVPKVATQVFQSGVATSYGATSKKWLDVSSSATPHYGFKYCIKKPTNTSGNNWQYRVYAKYFLEFKKNV